MFLIDDHPIVRLGLTQMINREADLEICGGAESLAGVLEAMDEAKWNSEQAKTPTNTPRLHW